MANNIVLLKLVEEGKLPEGKYPILPVGCRACIFSDVECEAIVGAIVAGGEIGDCEDVNSYYGVL